MEIRNIFFGIGIFFLFITLGYFVGTYLEEVPAYFKAALTMLLSVILFLIGDYMRRGNV